MKRRIAIPLEGNVLSTHFGGCEAFAFVDVENDEIINITILDAPTHEHGSYPRFVAEQNATDVIAGGMGANAISRFNEANINVFLGAPVDTPVKLVKDFIAGKLELNPNFCDHNSHGHTHHHHHHH